MLSIRCLCSHLIDKLLKERESVNYIRHCKNLNQLCKIVAQIGALLWRHHLLKPSCIVYPLFELDRDEILIELDLFEVST